MALVCAEGLMLKRILTLISTCMECYGWTAGEREREREESVRVGDRERQRERPSWAAIWSDASTRRAPVAKTLRHGFAPCSWRP